MGWTSVNKVHIERKQTEEGVRTIEVTCFCSVCGPRVHSFPGWDLTDEILQFVAKEFNALCM